MKILSVIVCILFLTQCVPMVHQPMKTSMAKLGDETSKYNELTNLPAPNEKIIAAVYKFRDQTGQYKMSEVGSNWSTAVTQGATSILIRSMEESGWFIPIEREGLPNLLNERKIIRSSRATYGNSESIADLLPPLLYAGVLLEGGIISFDSNVLTGGAGARYLGMSASGQYREDRVTIYLRAVSTVNGKILKTIYTSKTILSQKIDVGVFKFVAPQKLLEAETGFTYNEPAELAVREAIEQAVIGLIIEGIDEGLWKTQPLTKKDSLYIAQYNLQRSDKQLQDMFGTSNIKRRGFFGVNGHLVGSVFQGDYSQRDPQVGGQLGFEFLGHKPLSLGLDFFYGKVGSAENFEGDIVGSNLTINYKMLNNYRTTPYIKLGVGFIEDISNNSAEAISYTPQDNLNMSAHLGIEYLITDQFGIQGQMSYIGLLNDKFDKIEQGSYNDQLLSLHIGLSYYFNKKDKKWHR